MIEQIITKLLDLQGEANYKLRRSDKTHEDSYFNGEVQAYAEAISIVRKISKKHSIEAQQGSVLQSWVMKLPRRHQGVLLACVRGLDGAVKHAPEKPLVREMRGLILVPADAREIHIQGAYMTRFELEWSNPAFEDLLAALDSFPVHYIMHLVHAMQIIGYKHPDIDIQGTYRERYREIVRKWHLFPETENNMDLRLTRERINDPDLTE